MARKLSGFQRVLDAPALFSVAYGEIASSIYFALGIVAAHALGFTPVVLLGAGIFFLIVSLSYAEGTAAMPETGGAATFVRRAFNDVLGFLTGWALFLDYLIVIALSTLFLPHYLGDGARHRRAARVAVGHRRRRRVILAIAAVRLVAPLAAPHGRDSSSPGSTSRRSSCSSSSGSRCSSRRTRSRRASTSARRRPGTTSRSRCRSRCSPTRASRPSPTSPRRRASRAGRCRAASSRAIGLVVVLTVADRRRRARRRSRSRTARPRSATSGCRRRSSGSSTRSAATLPAWLGDALRVYVGLTGALVLLAAATTSISGFTRLAHSLGEHGQLPRELRAAQPAHARLAAGDRRGGRDLDRARDRHRRCVGDDVAFLASLYSFGVLLAFAAAQLAVIRLRVHRAATCRGRSAAPLVGAAPIGAPLAIAVWVVAMVTHPGARYAGPVWLALGLVVYLVVRRRAQHRAPRATSTPVDELPRRRRVPARARADEARADRRGDGRDGGRAREGARGATSTRSS